ncbi:MAG: copper resistance protein CopC [Solirubrobacterales bacterium]|nr:copper resistance protein CopC [Solirubrobacterales bacterium]
MRLRWRAAVATAAAAVAVALALAAPPVAAAHAYLVRTDPAASRVLESPPHTVALTYDEAVEPSFAIISVTDADGHQQTTGPVRRAPGNPDTLVVPLRSHVPEGWYLIYWRAISVDGHPVQGAFTYAVGPNPGPAPRFAVPSIAQSATSPNLLISRWTMFLSTMIAIGLFAFRFLVARSLPRRVPGTSLRAVSVAFVVASIVGLLAIPVYLEINASADSLRSAFDVDALVPLFRVTAFGRDYVDMLLCFGLFALAGWISLYLDRPDRERRSLAELAAQAGALLAAAAVLVFPGSAGHAGQTSPRGVSVPVDWLHLISGSLWLGGLIGLLVLWVALGSRRRAPALSVVVPRFSNLALASVATLLATGTIATIDHMPALDALWDTGYGVAILAKIAILLVAVAAASQNLLRVRPRLIAGPDVRAAGLLRRLVTTEAVLVVGAVFAAALLSSLAPPPPAFAEQNSAAASVGPGRVVQTLRRDGFLLQVLVTPNKAAAPDSFALRLTRGGRPIRSAQITLTLNHLEMEMPQQEYQLAETAPGVYSRRAPALIMVGRWGLDYTITPPSGRPFQALIVDQADG